MADAHSFDVFTVDHDDLKGGGAVTPRRSRVTVSATDFPSLALAADTACCIAVAMHGGMATACLLRI